MSFAMESAPGPQGHRNAPISNVHIEGLRFLGITVRLRCTNCTVQNCNFDYPSFQPDIPDVVGVANFTSFDGDNFVVANVTHTNTPHPMHLTGRNVTVENVLIENQGWYGTLRYVALDLRTVDSTVSNVEIRWTGNVGLQH